MRRRVGAGWEVTLQRLLSGLSAPPTLQRWFEHLAKRIFLPVHSHDVCPTRSAPPLQMVTVLVIFSSARL